jgi:hypothetical protein
MVKSDQRTRRNLLQRQSKARLTIPLPKLLPRHHSRRKGRRNNLQKASPMAAQRKRRKARKKQTVKHVHLYPFFFFIYSTTRTRYTLKALCFERDIDTYAEKKAKVRH